MTKKQRDLLMAYIYNQRAFMEEDIQVLQQNIRYRNVSQIDCLELIIAQEHLNTFNQVIADINHIIKISERE